MKKIIIFGLFCVSVMILGCGDSGNSGKTADNGNDSGREMGSLYGECYPNETCNKGLECDVDNNICLKKSDENNNEKNDYENDNPDTMPEECSENNDNSNAMSEQDSDNVEMNDDSDDNPDDKSPCKPNPCINVENSTGTCTAIDETRYSCWCKTNYTWDSFSKTCVKAQTPCDPNPCQNIQNSTGICTEQGAYNYSCGCQTNYTWNSSSKTCKADSKVSYCTGLPEHASWNTASSITQTWNGYSWAPSTTGTYNESASSSECRFICNTNYNWNGNSQCVAATKPATCYGLPDNAEWNTVSQITQSWNGAEWVPSAEGSYDTNADMSGCMFKCKTGYKWTNSECILSPECKQYSSTPCVDLNTNLMWSSSKGYGTSKITREEAESYCEDLSYGGFDDWHLPTISELRTLLISCSGTMPEGSCGLTDSCLSSSCWSSEDRCDGCDYHGYTYYSFWEAGWFWSSSVREDNTDLTWGINFSTGGIFSGKGLSDDSYIICARYICDFGLIWNGEECINSRIINCTNLPSGAKWNTTSKITQTWSGSEWIPSNKGSHNSEPSDSECHFICKEHYTWGVSSCYADRQKVDCEGLPDNNAEWNSVSQITQTWNGSEWSPSNNGVYNEDESTSECRFKCKEGYEWNRYQFKCEKCDEGYVWNKYLAQCEKFPYIDDSTELIWSSKSLNEMKWKDAVSYCENLDEDGLYGWYLPSIDDMRTLIQNCERTKTGGSCGITNDCFTSSCEPSYSSNCSGCSVDSTGKYSKFGDSETFWSNHSKIRNDSLGEDSFESWSVDFTKGKIEKNSKISEFFVRCVKQAKTVPCTGLPDNASWNSVSEIYQRWLETEWQTTVGTYNENSSLLECRFKCDSGYIWNGSKCQNPYTECSKTSGTPCSSGALMWSHLDSRTWELANTYCENLTYGGYSDWRLPTIAELRTLIQNCPNTVTGGSCAVTTGCLQSSCCLSYNCTCSTLDYNGNYSKFGDTDILWSSSKISDDYAIRPYVVDFSRAKITDDGQYNMSHYFRCVR